MDNQPTSPNSPGPEVAPTGAKPEDLRAGGEAPRPEMAPTPAGAPSTPPPKLSADDVAAALAAVPGPPAQNIPTPLPTPVTADDVDVIEPEWVVKAEDVVRAHIGDPYGEEEAIEELQQEYLKKRYGVSVSNPESKSKPSADNGKKPGEDSSKPEGT